MICILNRPSCTLIGQPSEQEERYGTTFFMKKYFIILATFLLLFSHGFVRAQHTAQLRGRVADPSGQPLPYATVALLNAKGQLADGATTDDDGAFAVALPPADSLRLRVHYLGFQTLDTLLIVREIRQPLQLTMLPKTHQLEEVTVETLQGAVTLKADKQVFVPDKLGNVTGGTALEVLQRLPSVTVNAEGKIMLRGNDQFLLTVNGKFTNQSPADVLAQIPAQAIEAIEVINTPSAGFDAEGKAGIVNIITRQNMAGGNGITVNAGTSGLQRYFSDLTFYHSAKSWNSFVAANFRRYDIDGFRDGEIRTLFQDTVTYSPSQGERPLFERVYGLRAGADFTLSSVASLNLAAYAGYRQNDRIANLSYRQYFSADAPTDLYRPFDETDLERTFYNTNLFSRTGRFFTVSAEAPFAFSRHGKLTVAALYEHSVLGGPLRNRDFDQPDGTLILYERSDEVSPLHAWRFQADYSRNIIYNLLLETGLQWRAVNHHGTFVFERLNLSDNTWQEDPEFSDELSLRQDIHAAYLQLGGQRGPVQFRAGLRAEHMFRTLTHEQGFQPITLDQFNLFPSGLLAWHINSRYDLKLSWSQRINRPTTKDLSPFKNHRHSEAIWIGDPYLLPELTQVAEATISRKHDRGLLSLAVYDSHTDNLIFRVNDSYNRITLYTISTNAGNSRSTGLELISEYEPLRWLSSFLSANAYWFRIRDIENATTDQAQSVNYNLSGNLVARIHDKWQASWSATYVSRTVTAQGFDTNLLLSNIQVTWQFHKLWLAGVLFQNIFNTNKQTITTYNQVFYSAVEYSKYDRLIQLSIGYRFNDSGKSARAVRTEYGEKDF